MIGTILRSDVQSDFSILRLKAGETAKRPPTHAYIYRFQRLQKQLSKMALYVHEERMAT